MDGISDWIGGEFGTFGPILVSTLIMFAGVTLATRAMGLRSFSKMSSTDFVTTVAVGSLIASVIASPDPSAVKGLMALASLFALKLAAAAIRRRIKPVRVLLDNEPLYLMRGTEVLQANLAAAAVSLSELHAKLRQANVWSYDQVISVVLETTGDVSVLQRSLPDAAPTPAIFADVRAA